MKLRLVSKGIALGLTATSSLVDAREPVQIEFRTVGDDALSQRVRQAIEERFRSSGRFVLAPAGSNPAALRMSIPGNVRWEPIGSRARVHYQLEFRRGEEAFGFFEGTCWETELAVCARQALVAANAAIETN